MNILLVDDEQYSVESIAASIDWNALGIQQVFQAYSKQQALSVFEKETVDILLSDIEMPRGSGLDLVEEIRAKGFNTVCLLLTCYSEFEYASRAIKLGISEYILKPVDFASLTKSLEQAVSLVEKERENAGKVLHGEFWEEQQQAAASNTFWDDLTNQVIPPSREKIEAAAAQRGVSTELLTREYYLLLLCVLPSQETFSWSKSKLEYALHNVLEELFSPFVSSKEDNRYLVVVPAVKYPVLEKFHAHCEEALACLKQTLPGEFLAYYCAPVPVEKAADAFHALERDAENRFSAHTSLFFHSQKQGNGLPMEIDYEKWRQTLTSRDPEPILEDIRRVLFKPGAVLEKEQLSALQFALIDTVYAVLEVYGLPKQLPQVAARFGGFPRSTRFPNAFYEWAKKLLEETASHLHEQEQSQSTLELVRAYIRSHIGSEITRNDIAAHVHFNPDYLSHIFRKQSGMSLSSFILQERLNVAKDLLLSTSLPVREIAIRTGFQSISYFSMQFKSFNGVTPLQYRKQHAS